VIDEKGNDIWRGKSSRACGFGRDFSIGWFEDGGGDEKLDFPAWDFIRDGTRKSWRDFIPMPKGTVLQPGVTGAALDSGDD
jgi:hypothetical protein